MSSVIWTCGHCRSRFSFALAHPTLGPICPLCLRPLAGGKRVRASTLVRRRNPGVKISQSRRLRIYERDGWVCQICGNPVDRDATGVDGPSLDHIRPFSQGGRKEWTNLQLAHVRCNSARGSTPLLREASA